MLFKKILTALILSLFIISCGNSVGSNETGTFDDGRGDTPQAGNPWINTLFYLSVGESEMATLPNGDFFVISSENLLLLDKDFNLKQALSIYLNRNTLFLLDSETLFSTNYNNELVIFKKIDGVWVLKEKFMTNKSNRTIAAFDEDTIALGASDKIIRIWENDGSGWKNTHNLDEHNTNVSALAVIGNDTLISGSNDGTVIVWKKSGSNWEAVQTITENSTEIKNLIVVEKGRRFISCSTNNLIIWEKKGDKWQEAERLGTAATSVIIDDETIITNMISNGMVFWEKTNGVWKINANKTLFLGPYINLKAMRKVDDITILAHSSGAFYKIEKINGVWKNTKTYIRHTGNVYAFAIINNTTLATGSSDSAVILWKKKNNIWQESKILFGQNGTINSMISIDEETIASSSSNEIIIWKNDKGAWDFYQDFEIGGSYLVAIDSETFASIISGSATKVTIWKKAGAEWVAHQELNGQNGFYYDAVAINSKTLVLSTNMLCIIWRKDDNGNWEEFQTINEVYGGIKPLTDESIVAGSRSNNFIKIWTKNEDKWEVAEAIQTKGETASITVIDAETFVQQKSGALYIWQKINGEWTNTKSINAKANKILPVKDGFLYIDNSVLRSCLIERN